MGISLQSKEVSRGNCAKMAQANSELSVDSPIERLLKPVKCLRQLASIGLFSIPREVRDTGKCCRLAGEVPVAERSKVFSKVLVLRAWHTWSEKSLSARSSSITGIVEISFVDFFVRLHSRRRMIFACRPVKSCSALSSPIAFSDKSMAVRLLSALMACASWPRHSMLFNVNVLMVFGRVVSLLNPPEIVDMWSLFRHVSRVFRVGRSKESLCVLPEEITNSVRSGGSA